MKYLSLLILSVIINMKLHAQIDTIRSYYPDSTLKAEYVEVDGQREGEFRYWDKNAKLSSLTNYKSGMRHGKYFTYYENGKIKSKGKCKHDVDIVGRYYYKDGSVQSWERSKKCGFHSKSWYEDGTLERNYISKRQIFCSVAVETKGDSTIYTDEECYYCGNRVYRKDSIMLDEKGKKIKNNSKVRDVRYWSNGIKKSKYTMLFGVVREREWNEDGELTKNIKQ